MKITLEAFVAASLSAEASGGRAAAPEPPTPLVGISLKLYLGYAETVDWLTRLRVAASAFDRQPARLFVLPSFPVLPQAQTLLSGSGIDYGAQNAYAAQRGPYTGEVSPAMLAELGATYVEVGHAERRRLFGEDDALVAAKLRTAAAAGLVPVLCVGEERRCHDAGTVVRQQLRAALQDFPVIAPLVVAYEPTWAIGAETPADAAYVAEVVGQIRTEVAGRSGTTRVLYGGSATEGTYTEMWQSTSNVGELPDGLFVGRAGHDIDRLLRIAGEVSGPERARNCRRHAG